MRKAMTLDLTLIPHVTLIPTCNGQLENGLGKVNGYGSRLHLGLLSLKTSDPHPHEDQ